MKEARKPNCPEDCKGPFENTACEYTCHKKNYKIKHKTLLDVKH